MKEARMKKHTGNQRQKGSLEALALMGALLLFTKVNVGIFFGFSLLLAMRWLLAGDPDPAQLDHFGRPTFVRPCLSGADRPKCGTAQWVGHSCYGCISQKFPLSRELLKWKEAKKCASELLLT